MRASANRLDAEWRPPMWPLIGLLSSTLLGVAAWRNGRTKTDFYASETYGMSARSHRRFAMLCGGFAVVFALASAWPLIPAVPLLGAFALAAILYLTSFLRGYADEEV